MAILLLQNALFWFSAKLTQKEEEKTNSNFPFSPLKTQSKTAK